MAKKVKSGKPVSRIVFLDFEFNRVNSPNVNLVSCVTTDTSTGKTSRFWLHNNEKAKQELRAHLIWYDIIIGYACVAEARSFLSLNLDPLEFDWIDLFLEYRMLTNHNDRLQWGEQLVNGKVRRFTKPPPKWERGEDDGAGFKPTHSLAEATFKLTGEIRDTVEKDEVRDLIISDPVAFTKDEKKRILDYDESDVVFLPRIWERIKEEYKMLCGNNLTEDDMQVYYREAMVRGRYSAHTAIMESVGYPINFEATKNFSRQITSIIANVQRDINSQFPENKPFKWNPRPAKFSWDQKATRKWLSANVDVGRWMKTDKGATSLSLEAWERVFPFKHEYPTGNFGAQMVRFLKIKQSLYGFSDSGGKRKNFWDSVGPDGRVRPYMNIFGAQSGRSQPAASGFMFLKPAWMRALVQPAPGKFLAGVDYGQQEFFLSGLESEDQNMIDAYLSGDPYMFGAKLAGVIPKDGKRENFKIERDLFKNTYLGILYGMTKYGLSAKLTGDTGREYGEEEAQDQIDLFEDTYPRYMEWRQELLESYRDGNGIKMACGWSVGPDNDNFRSVLNVPIQGMSASIMRKAVDIAVSRGCKVVFTLHDALYIEGDVDNEEQIVTLMESMRDAFVFYYKGTSYEEVAGKIKMDPFAWSSSYRRDSEMEIGSEVIPVSDMYRDERSLNELERFSKYFEEPDTELL